MLMPPVHSPLLMGAALSSDAGAKAVPHLSTATALPGLLSLGFVLAVAFFPLVLGRRGPKPAGPENDDGDGWGRRGPDRPPTPKGGPTGGIPLPDAIQSRIRMRGPGRLSEHRQARVRRPAREPERRPIRTLTPG
jgi:hypothetical protein